MVRIIIKTIIGPFLGLFFLQPLMAQESGLDEPVASQTVFKIVGFGDSLMAGYMLDGNQSFTAKLEEALRAKNYTVALTNAGVSGDTSTGGRDRIDWSVPDDTNLVILELGANDMLRGIAPDLTRKNLHFMLTRLKQRGISVILVGMLSAPNYGADYAKKFNPIYGELAQEFDVPLYPFFLEGVAGHADLQLQDGMHPNADGVDRMVENFMPMMEKELARLDIKPVSE